MSAIESSTNSPELQEVKAAFARLPEDVKSKVRALQSLWDFEEAEKARRADLERKAGTQAAAEKASQDVSAALRNLRRFFTPVDAYAIASAAVTEVYPQP